ncbi:DJ-1/PfpI family protein [Pelagibacterium sp. 26DY04]|uniref:DJ-1/PfpI family protein n=1 Tax=Pelagibacterium sp. 26DY04 TaxID=2967130 RepID=UPI002814E1CC|nr:DJ-1/PfpI family protein [Pelagibacterium sp. 26DY04]WMT85793.1 DJ-1/PfpI family protein [Pelagibacterium sp. 26DY04]
MNPITIILTQGYSDWEIAVLAGVGRAFFNADIGFASAEGGTVTSVGGIVTEALERFEAPEQGVVVVCGGPTFEGGTPPDLSARLRQAHENGCVVAGICGGTLALARAGLLDRARHTSNGADYLDAASGYGGAALYVDQPQALRDGPIITAPAPAPASFAMEVLMAAGVESQAAGSIMDMLAKEHGMRAGS